MSYVLILLPQQFRLPLMSHQKHFPHPFWIPFHFLPLHFVIFEPYQKLYETETSIASNVIKKQYLEPQVLQALLLHLVSSLARPGFSPIVTMTLCPLHRHANGVHCLFLFCSFLFLWLAEAGKYETITQLLKQAVSSQPLSKHINKYGLRQPILHVLTCSPEAACTICQWDKIEMGVRWDAVILCLQEGFGLKSLIYPPPPCCYFCLLNGVVLQFLGKINYL